MGALAVLAVVVAPSSAGAVTLENGRFVTVCQVSHESRDDPIVLPKQPGLSHLHHFFGNRSTNARTTPRKLRRSKDTSCNADDRSAYWIPALKVNEQVIEPLVLRSYYSSFMKDPRTVQPFPRGLRIIGGDAYALQPQQLGITAWGCFAGAVGSIAGFTRLGTGPPYCGGNGKLALNVNFPDCWDGVNLDSPDHQSHMAYAELDNWLSTYATCPASHPVPLPALHMKVIYPTQGAREGVELSSGGVYSAHADFMNGWPQQRIEALVADCIRKSIDCKRN